MFKPMILYKPLFEINMKSISTRLLLLCALSLFFQFANAQIIPDSITSPKVGDTVKVVPPIDTVASPVRTVINDVPLQYVDFRAFKNIDIDSLKQQKTDLDAYMKNIDAMEELIKTNYKELGKQYTIANNEMKLIDSDYKLLDAKRKIVKTDEKLLKQEKKLRDKELKSLKSERKAFDKASKNMAQADIDVRLQRFMDHEARIGKAQDEWFTKQDKIKDEYKQLNDSEMKILRKESDIKARIAELDRYKNSLKLKQKQLKVEKKQVQLEMKKAKLEMKAAGAK